MPRPNPVQDRNGRPTDGPFQPIERRRMSDQVYEEVLNAILEHRFKPGERLSIPELSRSLDVSQMPVRQAIDRLSEEGLVEIRPRSGTFVAQADEREVAETFDIRRALDALAAETAVEHVTDHDLSDLEGLVEEMDGFAALGSEGMGRHDRLNWEFHLLIVRLSGNEKLHEMYKQLNAHLKIASVHVSSKDWAARVPRAQSEHRAMVQALRERSASQLASILAVHVERGKAALIRDIRASQARLKGAERQALGHAL